MRGMGAARVFHGVGWGRLLMGPRTILCDRAAGGNMTLLHPAIIDSWHAHVYFEASSREAAWALRETVTVELAGRMEMGRFHEKPVGPHPMWSYQLPSGLGALAGQVAYAEPGGLGRLTPCGCGGVGCGIGLICNGRVAEDRHGEDRKLTLPGQNQCIARVSSQAVEKEP